MASSRKRIHAKATSSVSVKSELDLFSAKSIQHSINGSYWIDVQPISALSPSNPITFHVAGSDEEYLDPIFYLKTSCCIRTHEDKLLPENIAVAPINNFGHSMFKRIDLKLQDKLVTSSTDNYPHRAFLERFLNFGSDAKNSQLGTEFYHADTAGKNDVIEPGENAGFEARKALVSKGRPFTLFVRLCTDLANQPRLLPNGVDVTLTLHHSSDAFRLTYPDQMHPPKLVLRDMLLYIRKVKLTPPMATALAEAMRLKPVQYAISRAMVKTFQISKGLSVINRENLTMGQLPRSVVVGVCDSDAYLGNPHKTPLSFKAKGANFVSLYCDSEPIPSVPFTPNFTENDAAREYLSLFHIAGTFGGNQGNCLTYSDYIAGGYVLYCFDLTKDESAAANYNAPLKQANLSLKMQFNTDGINQTCTVIVYMVFDNTIYIDHHRNVLTDFT